MKKNTLFITTLALLVALATQAQQNVAVFKNGSAFFVNKMQVNASKGYYLLDKVPAATFGTLWFTADNNTIKGTRSYMESVRKKQKVKNKMDVLRANQGKMLTLTLSNNKTYTGVVQRLDGNMVVFSTGGKWMTFAPGNVEMVVFSQAPAAEYTQKQKKRVLKIDFAKANASQTFEMMYLQKGISWVPNYAVALRENKKAVITLKANLMNDVEDLKNASINFVVGVPNFAYDYLQSPVASTQRVSDFISRLNRNSNRSSSRLRNRADITTQRLSNFTPRAFNGNMSGIRGLKGQSAEDLYFYNTSNITLKKGDRAFYEIFKANVDYEDIYEVSLNANSSSRSSYSKSYAQSDQSIGKVWHSIRLQNKTSYPWTTGTVLITKEISGVAKPLSQDKLNYTPPGSKTKLKMTISPNINVKSAEREVSREEKKTRKDRYTYDLLTVESKIDIKNYHNKDIKLSVCRTITGEPIKCNTKWKTNKKFSVYNNINMSHDLDWEVKLKKGEKKTITYQYKIYVRR
ncbi:hypothetical protein [uncultured Microscilla sp.]|uniref:hypothetical protein n=1 Tax=uncultured Microscilla sp. TaxID=432653 RepID=UPI00261BF53F|nr:hypothetical protein [uncultured Microscilla sp.]